MIKLLLFLYNHPIRKFNTFLPFKRFVFWQLLTLFYRGHILYNWIFGIKILVRKGDYGFTGNIYTVLEDFNDMIFLLKIVNKNDIFIDVGANVGSYTLLITGYTNCKTISFEPTPSTFKLLNKNVLINDFYNNITLRNLALGETNGKLRFNASLNTENHIIPNHVDSDHFIYVSVSTLNEEVKRNKNLILKIDTEGYELNVLKGSSSLLSQGSFIAIILEVNTKCNVYKTSYSDIKNYLFEFNYLPVSYDFKQNIISHNNINFTNSKNIVFTNSIAELSSRLKYSKLKIQDIL